MFTEVFLGADLEKFTGSRRLVMPSDSPWLTAPPALSPPKKETRS